MGIPPRVDVVTACAGRSRPTILISMPAPHIRLLPDAVINKIAAGEVVERPASVVKELMENALDAGATQIEVDTVEGGRKLVRVRDNGSGMGRDDALLCIQRHATSKIQTIEDIEQIGTLGFRGEALAAIAAVSRFRLLTCLQGETMGTEIFLSGGKLQDVREVGTPPGTTVEVRDLFFNVPARRKFLRSSATEADQARAVFITLALAHPDRRFLLRMDGREHFRLLPSNTIEERIRDLFGPDYAVGLRGVRQEAHGVRVTGRVTLPSVSRSDRAEQFIFVNGRAATAPLITQAIRESYRSLLPADRHPGVILFVTLDPRAVDVNVHPTKKEVRFRQPAEVREVIFSAIRQALGSPGLPITLPRSSVVATPPAVSPSLTIDDLPSADAFPYPRLLPPEHPAATGTAPPNPARSVHPELATTVPETGSATSAPWSWCRVVGQIGGLYVLLETEDGMVIMDPHAAHERVLFERFMAQVKRREVQTQTLMTPETLDVQPVDAARIRRFLPLLREMGFGISEFGGDSFLIDALPACVAGGSVRSLLIEIAHGLEVAGTRAGKERWREEAIAQAACRAAVKTKDRLDLREIQQLVVDLASTEMPYTCPHGRPTLIFTSFRELHRKFARG